MITLKEFMDIELLETKLQMGKYNIPWTWPNASHRGLERIYNSVWPKLAEIVGVPARNVKFKGWDATRGTFIIKVSNPKTEVDMIEIMAPKALKNLLEQIGMQDVKTNHVTTATSKATRTGIMFPMIEIAFTADYPEQWKQWDKERYNRK